MKNLKALAITTIFLYLIGSFIFADLNYINWNITGRLIISIIYFIILLYIGLSSYFD